MGDALTWVDKSSRDGPHSLLALLSEMIPGSGARYRHLGLEGAMPAEAGAGGPPPLQPGQPRPFPEPQAGILGGGPGSIFPGGLVLGLKAFEAQGLSPVGEKRAAEELLKRNPGQRFHESLP